MSMWPGDWNCSTCQHHNFSRRDTCQHCGSLRSSSAGAADTADTGGGYSAPYAFVGAADVRPGDWYCLCGGHNFASRLSCLKCGGFKDDSAVGCFEAVGGDSSRARAEWKSGDWLCTRGGCSQHNFASRRECFRCKAPRGCGA